MCHFDNGEGGSFCGASASGLQRARSAASGDRHCAKCAKKLQAPSAEQDADKPLKLGLLHDVYTAYCGSNLGPRCSGEPYSKAPCLPGAPDSRILRLGQAETARLPVMDVAAEHRS